MEFLKARTLAAQPKVAPAAPAPPPPPSRNVLAAIAFMRSPEGGNWAISATGQGDFYFGCTRLTGPQLVDRAKRKGWDGSGDMMTVARTLAHLRG
ncbi:hypothetical protein [Novosphingobium sp.]|uniref:hypothetical protein n=1 Tax=Novosphingobium sp. TaxID=1874826 RepID=UPI002FDB1C1F